LLTPSLYVFEFDTIHNKRFLHECLRSFYFQIQHFEIFTMSDYDILALQKIFICFKDHVNNIDQEDCETLELMLSILTSGLDQFSKYDYHKFEAIFSLLNQFYDFIEIIPSTSPLFKPLIYIGCIFMILFWYSYNQIINQISSKSKINNFLIFGYLSCFFLFLHVLLLGVEIDNKIFKLTRKIVIVAFILFEVIAQYALLKQIYLLKNKISDLINEVYLNLKILLVGSVIVATFFIVAILLLYDLNKKIDYILEWNYFLILLFYYLFSFLMWKKNSIKLPSNPSTS